MKIFLVIALVLGSAIAYEAFTVGKIVGAQHTYCAENNIPEGEYTAAGYETCRMAYEFHLSSAAK